MRRRVSTNTLALDSLANLLALEQERELYESFERLADDPEECDVEFAFLAQSEVALHDEA